MRDGFVELELKTPGKLLDDIVRLRKVLETIVDLSDFEMADGDGARKLAREALAHTNGDRA